MDDLTISIGTLDNYPVLERCLRSIYEEDAPWLTYRVWVVYNGSGDDTVPSRIEAFFPQVTLIRKSGPLGYCATHNLVLSQCESRYVLILDDDTIVPRGTLARMVAFMDADLTVGMAGCKTLNPDGSFQKTYGLLPSLRTELSSVFRPDSFWPARLYENTLTVREVEWLNGSFMLVRSRAVEEVGLLDEHYYTYVCEPDWCYRMCRAGWRVVFVPDADIIHVGGEHSINNKQTATSYVNLVRYHVNRYYFFHKHYGRWASALLRLIMGAGLVARLIHYALIHFGDPQRRPMARVRLKAFWESLKLGFVAKPYILPQRFAAPVGAPPAAAGSRGHGKTPRSYQQSRAERP